MQATAIICGTFKLDPVEVLKSDYFDFRLRLKTAEKWHYLKNKANEKK